MTRDLRDLEQKRAQYALIVVKRRGDQFKKGSRERERYLNRVKSLPATIMMNGLGQTLATLLAASKGVDNPDRIIYNDLDSWLCARDGIFPGDRLMNALTNTERRKYLIAQVEALKLLEWQKKFATAFLSSEEVADDDAPTL